MGKPAYETTTDVISLSRDFVRESRSVRSWLWHVLPHDVKKSKEQVDFLSEQQSIGRERYESSRNDRPFSRNSESLDHCFDGSCTLCSQGVHSYSESAKNSLSLMLKPLRSSLEMKSSNRSSLIASSGGMKPLSVILPSKII